MPERSLISVDLPAPFSPQRAWTSPARRSNATFLSATTPGNFFVRPRASRIADRESVITTNPQFEIADPKSAKLLRPVEPVGDDRAGHVVFVDGDHLFEN